MFTPAVVYLLFQRRLVRLVSATDSFSMVFNMPAKCVIFEDVSKYDGFESRNLTASEYIQMAGRAGRRGIDSTGTVIITARASVCYESSLKRMVVGQATELSSNFKVTHAMILNSYRGDLQTRPEELINRSYLFACGDQFERIWKQRAQRFQECLLATTMFEDDGVAAATVSSPKWKVSLSVASETDLYTLVRCQVYLPDSAAVATAAASSCCFTLHL
ncbi:unnamed protein product [Mesocestoides corti]|uniref:Helicase C-terminal domain-containing protein n=2 Tax=Mesocestoides corti TaxID=53468 RepID=A0A0R3UEW1_MESCO|nr:unnamed protein product [Mesocestoides corti]